MYAQDVFVETDILASSRDASGELRVNLGDSRDGSGIAADASLWAADGFFGRPVDPDEDGACMALYHIEGNQKRVLATKDNRFVSAYSELEPGDRAIVTDGSARVFVKRATNQIALYTENGGDSSAPMIHDLNGETGVISLMTSDASGNVTQIQLTPTGITLTASSSSKSVIFSITPDIISAFCEYMAINAGRGHLGVIGSVPPPPTSGLLYGTSGVTGIPSVNWTVAP